MAIDRRSEIAGNLEAVREQISKAAESAGRSVNEITLIAVTKTFPASDVEILKDLGVSNFGENRDSDAAPKAVAISGTWHFQGQIQSNKLKSITSWANVIHSLDEIRHFEVIEKNFDIKSIGYDDFEGQLNHNVSAHPKVDARTGDLFAFGYNFEKPILHFSVFDKNRHCNLKNQKIKISTPRMIHDFCITENHIIFPDLPMEVNGEKAVRNNKFIFDFDKTKPARYGVM